MLPIYVCIPHICTPVALLVSNFAIWLYNTLYYKMSGSESQPNKVELTSTHSKMHVITTPKVFAHNNETCNYPYWNQCNLTTLVTTVSVRSPLNPWDSWAISSNFALVAIWSSLTPLYRICPFFRLLCILVKTFYMHSTEVPLSIFQYIIHHEVW